MQQPSINDTVTQRLPHRPQLSDLQRFLAQAVKTRDKVVIAWTGSSTPVEYTLSVEANNLGDDPEWRMHMVTESLSKVLWMYVSLDPQLVYNLVVTSLPEEERDSPKQAGGRNDRLAFDEEPPKNNRHSTDSDDGGNDKAGKDNPKKAVLSGDLALVQVTNLLPSMQMARMTGKLTFENAHCRTHVYFEDGAPVHAFSEEEEGTEALLEVLTWKEGHFNFQPKEQAPKKTVDQPLDTLMLKGVKIIDNAAFLSDAGIDADSLLDKKQSKLSKPEFDAIVKSSKLDTGTLKKLYEKFNGTTTLAEAARGLGLPRSKWAGLVAQLFRLDLIQKVEPKMASVTLMPKLLDAKVVETIQRSLQRSDTGMYTYDAFLYFLEMEYLRRFRSEGDLAVIVFEMKTIRQGSIIEREPLTIENINDANKRMNMIKRPLDFLCHYENDNYALLLPNTKSQGAAVLAARLVDTFRKEPLETANGSDIALSMGVAGMPDDFLDPPFLLAGAEAAKNEAVKTNASIVQFKDLPDDFILM